MIDDTQLINYTKNEAFLFCSSSYNLIIFITAILEGIMRFVQEIIVISNIKRHSGTETLHTWLTRARKILDFTIKFMHYVTHWSFYIQFFDIPKSNPRLKFVEVQKILIKILWIMFSFPSTLLCGVRANLIFLWKYKTSLLVHL